MRAGIIYTYAGSWAVALRSLDIPIVWHVISKEFDRAMRGVFKANFPEVPVFQTPDEIDSDVDLMVGSPPCFGMTCSNRQTAGPDHPLNRLTLGFAKTVATMRPLGFVMEMVPPFLRPKFEKLYGEYRLILDGDFNVMDGVVNFAEYGVPQIRRRAIVMGVRRDVGPAPVFLPPLPEKATIRQAFEGLPGLTEEEAVGQGLAKKFDPKLKGPYRIFVDNPEGARLKWDGQARTVTAAVYRAWKHPGNLRHITWREAARIMEFPDDFLFEGSLAEKMTQIADGVPCRGIVNFIVPVLEEIIGHLEKGR